MLSSPLVQIATYSFNNSVSAIPYSRRISVLGFRCRTLVEVWWGHSLASGAKLCPDPRSQARSRHRRIETTSFEGGRDHAVGLYVLLSDAGTPIADPPALRLPVGRKTHRSPLLSLLGSLPMPFGL